MWQTNIHSTFILGYDIKLITLLEYFTFFSIDLDLDRPTDNEECICKKCTLHCLQVYHPFQHSATRNLTAR
jgi:hypothetical protein